ncbi:MAG TPA: threonine ammonia-lyase [Acidimicrobiales bacterium]|nr:threonine ammonia-lyase [Acidimicrobiales bacterium]
MISRADIDDAALRLDGVLRSTPVTESDNLTKLAGREVLLKPEHLQRTGSYKIRGAFNLISRLDAGVNVVAASAGNHAQGVALAASLTGRKSTIFMPRNAPLPKVEATRSYGANIEFVTGMVDDCLGAAQDFADANGSAYVPPFDHELIIAGQGTVGLEIAREAPDAEVVVVPIGGGGLVAGVATALAHTRREVKVIGVQAAGAASMRDSVAERRVVTLPSATTMADGIAVLAPSELTLAHVTAYVDDIVTVDEESISRALLLLLERAKAVVEPAGAVALAAVLSGAVPGNGPAVAVLSGGNIDPLLLTRVIEHGLSAAGRYLVVRVVLGDKPGELAALTGAVADLGLNVLSVEHHRSGASVGINEVEVLLTLETRDPAHRTEIVVALNATGFRSNLVR